MIIPELTQIQKLTLNRAKTLLAALEFSYAIVDSTGLVHGNLETKNHKRKREKTYPHGERTAYAREYVSHMEVGHVANVPFDYYDPDDLRSSVLSVCWRKWGKKSIVSTINRKTRHVEIMRVK